MKSWSDVENSILTKVFASQEREDILSSSDLSKDGLLKSLSIVSILSILQEANAGVDYMLIADGSDFLTMSAIESLYTKGGERG